MCPIIAERLHLEYQVPIGQAAEILGVSERHARRLLNAYRRDGASALAHGNRGRQPHNAVLASEAAAGVRLASTEYAGTNHTHLTELLREREGINLSRPTVRRILVNTSASMIPSTSTLSASGTKILLKKFGGISLKSERLYYRKCA